MTDPNNYTLDWYHINRSRGAQLTENFLPPKLRRFSCLPVVTLRLIIQDVTLQPPFERELPCRCES